MTQARLNFDGFTCSEYASGFEVCEKIHVSIEFSCRE